MIYNLKGVLRRKEGKFVVIGVGGVEFLVAVPLGVQERLPAVGKEVALFTHLYFKEGGVELYGFLSESELQFFEALISVTGIGPKSALSILGVAPAEQLMTAISKGKVDLLERSSGIGHKTAERIVLELKDKLGARGDEGVVGLMEADNDLLEALVSLGYPKQRAKEAVKKIDPALATPSERLRDALRKIKT